MIKDKLFGYYDRLRSRLEPHKDMIDKWGFDAACIAAPVILFLIFFNPHVLDPTRIGWLMTHDWGQHVLGWNAFRHVPWSWAFYYQDLLASPTGLSIIYTDSNPPLAFLFKILSPILPQNFQYIGPWFFLCVALQVYVAYRLIRPFAPGKWTALGGAITLSVLPTLYYRMRHDTLVAHWLILWALHIFINIKEPQRRLKYFALNNFITGMIHPYLLVMTAAIWSGDVIRSLWPAYKRRDMPGIVITLRDAALVLAAPIVAMGLVGTYAAGQSAGAGGFGYYSMGIDALINPVSPYFSNFMKAWRQDGGQAFEGWQYLGFGLLVLLAFAGIFWWLKPEVRRTKPFFTQLWPLILPCIGLTILALSNHVQLFNVTLFKYELPPKIMEIMAILRASGRFFWPISYLLVMGALVVVFALPKRIIAPTLAIVLTLQAIDLSGFAHEMRRATAAASSTRIYRLTPDKNWDTLVRQSKGVRVYPAQVHFNQRLFYELAWRSTSNAKPINTMYAARENLGQIAIEQREQAKFLRGELKPDHLYVFLKQCYAPKVLQSKLRELDGVWIIPPEALKDMELAHPQWQPIAPQIKFGWLDQGACLLDDNWSRPGYNGAWALNDSPSLTIPVGHIQFDVEHPRTMKLALDMESRQPLKVAIIINKRKIKTLDVTPDQVRYQLNLPRSMLSQETLWIEFDIEEVEREDMGDDGTPQTRPDQALKPGPQTKLIQGPALKLKKAEFIASSGL